jgi:hypothetical protein
MTVKGLSVEMEALVENGQADIEVMEYDMYEGWKPYVYEDSSFHGGKIYLGLPEVTVTSE